LNAPGAVAYGAQPLANSKIKSLKENAMSERLFKDDVVFLQRLLKCAGLYTDRIDGDWGPNTEEAVEAFDREYKRLAQKHGSFDTRTERNIMTLLPKAQEAARIFMRSVQGLGPGVIVRIISGTRTYAEQNEIFKIGRFGNPGKIVTKARGGQSNHNFGIAWDIGIFQGGTYLKESPLYAQAAKAALPKGVEWGGNWKGFVDRPHYQLITGLIITKIRERFERGQAFI
jgi:peptidoglycan L-alanyl-D-glutamate endopeptidase CwlK